jgi:predicted metal-dependent hydrolase
MPMSTHIDVSIPESKSISVELRRSKKAKHMCIRADLHGICVVVPTNESVNVISDFVQSKAPWIFRTYQYYLSIKEKIGGEFQRDTLLFLGNRYKIRITKDREQEYAVVSENLMQITFHVIDRRSYKRYLHVWYKEQTKKILEQRVPILSRQFHLSYTNVTVKALRSKWGSCSKKGNLSFNHLLAMLPMKVVDYIIVHELVHLIEFNHSKKFWYLVESAIPDYRDHRNWLRSHAIVVQID